MNVSAVAVRACHRGTRNAYTNLCTVTETKEENAQVKYSCKTGTLNGTKCITQTTRNIVSVILITAFVRLS